MSESGGLRKYEKTQHARVGLGSTAHAVAVEKRHLVHSALRGETSMLNFERVENEIKSYKKTDLHDKLLVEIVICVHNVLAQV